MKRYRLSKAALVRKGWEYDAVYRRGSRLRGDGFTLICQSNTTEMNRLGISVHRKIRGAVERNRLKRIIRESFRLHRDDFPQGADIVFAVRPDFSLSNPEQVRQAVLSIQDALKGAGND